MNKTRSFLVGPDEQPDKYRLHRWMDGGGEADLWEASLTLAGEQERVAVKILRPDHFTNVDGWRSQWSEQVELLRLIQHPSVVSVHCYFEGARMHLPGQANLTDRTLYLVMNWVDGQALRDWVPLHHDSDHQTAGLRYLSQVAEVLDLLHSGQATSSGRSIVHCDISPANVIINSDGQAVLVDFGLFRIVAHFTADIAAGTRGYCAPEVLQRGEYSIASDRYAFGALAYFVLTGQHPPADLAQLREGARAIPYLGDQPERIDHLMTIFAAEPEQRPSPREWIRGLRMYASTVLPGSVPLPPPSPSRSPGTSASPRTDAAAATLKARLRQWSPSAMVTIVVLLAVVAWLVSMKGLEQQQATGPVSGRSTAEVGSGVPSNAVTPTVPTSSPSSPSSPAQELSATPDQPREQSLTDMAPVEGSYEIGPQKVNTQRYERTLYGHGCYTSAATWQLDRKYTSFRASVGLSDTSPSSAKVKFSVFVDGETKATYSMDVGILQPIPPVDLRNAFRVELKVESDSCLHDGYAVWINPVIS